MDKNEFSAPIDVDCLVVKAFYKGEEIVDVRMRSKYVENKRDDVLEKLLERFQDEIVKNCFNGPVAK